MGLQVETEIEQRLFEDAPFAEIKRDEQPPDPAIAIEEGMYRLELDMGERRLDQGRQAALLFMEEALKVAHQVEDAVSRWRDEEGVARPRTADPVLRGAERARLLSAAAPGREQDGVHLQDQAQRERKAAGDTLQPVAERADVGRDLFDIIDRRAGRLVLLIEQEIGQRGLCTLDLGGEQRLLAHIHVEEEGRVRRHGTQAVKPPQRQHRFAEQSGKRRKVERRHGRQGLRHIGTNPLASDGTRRPLADAFRKVMNRHANIL